jgi:hypothetical protein
MLLDIHDLGHGFGTVEPEKDVVIETKKPASRRGKAAVEEGQLDPPAPIIVPVCYDVRIHVGNKEQVRSAKFKSLTVGESITTILTSFPRC